LILVFLGALCSVLIAHLLKWNSHHATREPQIYWVNYLLATILCFIASSEKHLLLDPKILPEIAFAALIGLFYVTNLMLMASSVATNGIGITLSVMRISLVFPVLFSVYFFDEHLTVFRIIGLGIAFIALMVLFNPSKEATPSPEKAHAKRNLAYLAIIFLITGLSDVGLKTFESMESAQMDTWLFMAVIFLVCTMVMSVLIKKQTNPWPKPKEWVAGTWIGLPNVAGTAFMLTALTTVPASVAFPVSNLSIIIMGTLLGRIYWKDALTIRQYSVITMCTLAILLLTI